MSEKLIVMASIRLLKEAPNATRNDRRSRPDRPTRG